MKLNTNIGSIGIKIDTKRIDENVREAQKLLNLQIAADCDPLIPFRQGALRNSVSFPDGVYGGIIEYDTPYAHMLYVGQVYGPNIPIKDSEGNITGWFSPPKKHPTGREITYHTPGTGKEWFEEGKRQHGADWVELVKRTTGKD